MEQAAGSSARRRSTSARARWLKALHGWHWVSAAISLSLLALFSVTGITLNHAAQIPGQPHTVSRHLQLPETLRARLATRSDTAEAALPEEIGAWLRDEAGIRLTTQPVEWSGGEAYVSLPRPGGDGWISIDTDTGRVEHESTDRGWIAYLNDLHKGRNTGAAWRWIIDLFALACLVFALTGLGLLWLHRRHRPMTWPLVALGLALPVLTTLVFIHR